ncbi:hypothetical protein BDR04DRAFT_409207 [Suillus decipiens]|nr:hypothetical protein BDR04DRAFT_409207 [Suillus decipiens]
MSLVTLVTGLEISVFTGDTLAKYWQHKAPRNDYFPFLLFWLLLAGETKGTCQVQIRFSAASCRHWCSCHWELSCLCIPYKAFESYT